MENNRELNPKYINQIPEYREPILEYREPILEYREPILEYIEPIPEYRDPIPVYRERLIENTSYNLLHQNLNNNEDINLNIAIQQSLEDYEISLLNEFINYELEFYDTVHGLDDTVHGIDDTVHGLDDTVHGLDDTVHRIDDEEIKKNRYYKLNEFLIQIKRVNNLQKTSHLTFLIEKLNDYINKKIDDFSVTENQYFLIFNELKGIRLLNKTIELLQSIIYIDYKN